MASINWDSINSKIKTYKSSDKCRRKINERPFMTEEMMDTAAHYLRAMIVEIAESRILAHATGEQDPSSVIQNIKEDLYIGRPYRLYQDRQGYYLYKIDITHWEYDFRRESLFKEDPVWANEGSYTGEGIDNIVSLFDTGYSASGNVYGAWQKRNIKNIKSLSYRQPLEFMRDAVYEFNYRYGAQFHCEASISADDGFYVR